MSGRRARGLPLIFKEALWGKYSSSLTRYGMFAEVKESAITHGEAVRQYSRVTDSHKRGHSKMEALQITCTAI